MSTRNLNQEERNQIIILHGQGLNISQIAVELNLQRTTVRRWVRRYEEEGSLTERVRAPRRRAINEEQLHNMIEQKAARVRFAREYRDFDFTYAIFSDEKCFRSSQQGRRNLWRIDNTRYEPRNVIPNAESGRVVVNMWGWMSAAGPGELAFIPGRANGHTYRDVLHNIMLPTVRTVYPKQTCQNFIFPR
ncbi:hypothetical protein HF086_017701 [Spodoptera exigua]|uniref:Uncharacterized protein n=1 Tax=Spodoptera exigua TaxID=7107 RepID=A0A922S8W3_SPOEX|nr:hypothetical protein HF086_017701 [Spodoptera exigua]